MPQPEGAKVLVARHPAPLSRVLFAGLHLSCCLCLCLSQMGWSLGGEGWEIYESSFNQAIIDDLPCLPWVIDKVRVTSRTGIIEIAAFSSILSFLIFPLPCLACYLYCIQYPLFLHQPPFLRLACPWVTRFPPVLDAHLDGWLLAGNNLASPTWKLSLEQVRNKKADELHSWTTSAFNLASTKYERRGGVKSKN